MSEEQKKLKKLGTYAIVLFLAAVLIIIVAAMADDREELYENQLKIQEQTNLNIQNEIVLLKDENYHLKSELEKIKEENAAQKADLSFYQALENVWNLYTQDKEKEANEVLSELEKSDLKDEQKALLSTYKNILRKIK